MLRLLSEPTNYICSFRNSPWAAQQTFATPLDDLPRFVGTILSVLPCSQAAIATDEVVFEARNMFALLQRHGIAVEDPWRFQISAETSESVAELFQAALGDWIDFVLVPYDSSFAIYADHDEYTTFYAPDGSRLINLAAALTEAGFHAVQNYIRPSYGMNWK